MTNFKLSINGFGRIGRVLFRIAINRPNITIVGINDMVSIDQLAYLLKYDSVHGRFDGCVEIQDNNLIVNGKTIRITSEPNPEKLNWEALDVDVVAECTGRFTTLETAGLHLMAGAKKVIISAPSSDVPMFVMGVNHNNIHTTNKIVSNASCTTNCLAPLAKVLHDNFEIEEGLMTTIHATTSTQFTTDSPSQKNFRLGRSALNNIIHSSTGAAKAVGKVIPELEGKMTGMAFRVPVANVSAVDLTVKLKNPTSYATICNAYKIAAAGSFQGIIGYCENDLVSQDFIGDARTCIFDVNAGIQLSPTFFKLVAWYDNEFGYANKLLDLSDHIHNL